MGHVMYCYTGWIMDRASCTEETLLNFLLNYGSREMGHDGVAPGNWFPQVDGLSMDPRDLRRHNTL